MTRRPRIAIIGAGPIGLEAALAGMERGFDVVVYERGAIAQHVRGWGHVPMFSPFGMNASEAGKARVRSCPDDDALLTGAEYADAYLAPLGATLPVQTGVEVLSIARSGALKGEKIGAADRGDTRLKLLLARQHEEWLDEADIVFDCTGTFSTPNSLGDGGMPAPGERACRDLIDYGMPKVTAQLAGKRVLVLGGGHSAATAVWDLARVEDAGIIWATRKAHSPPCARVPDDPLSARDRLVEAANALAVSRAIDFRPGRSVLALKRSGDSVCVMLGEDEKVEVDRIIACVGFRPDPAMTRELQTQTCWATEGTYPLAAMMLGETGIDCLAAPVGGAETLLHPEPGYFALGIKSYGRTPNFLIRTGREQIENACRWLEQR